MHSIFTTESFHIKSFSIRGSACESPLTGGAGPSLLRLAIYCVYLKKTRGHDTFIYWLRLIWESDPNGSWLA
jgi:hypothetical protein